MAEVQVDLESDFEMKLKLTKAGKPLTKQEQEAWLSERLESYEPVAGDIELVTFDLPNRFKIEEEPIEVSYDESTGELKLAWEDAKILLGKLLAYGND